jgi:hypothetical protein
MESAKRRARRCAMRKAGAKPGMPAKEAEPLAGPAKGRKEEAEAGAQTARASVGELKPQEGPTERDQEEVVATMRDGWGVRS